MAENKNEVAETKATAISTFDDTLLSGGTGLEETTTEDFAIPFIRVLQPLPCLLYTSPSPRDGLLSRMPSSA